MQQLTQKLKSGEMRIREVPLPALSAGMVLVRNHYSVISAGTEGSTVKTARKSLIGKARERPQQVKQVLDVLTRQGPVQAGDWLIFRPFRKNEKCACPLAAEGDRPRERFGSSP